MLSSFQTLFSIPKAAEVLGISETQGRRLVKAGLLRSVKIGARILVPGEEVERARRDGVPYPPKADRAAVEEAKRTATTVAAKDTARRRETAATVRE